MASAFTNFDLVRLAKFAVSGFIRGIPALNAISTKFEDGVGEKGCIVKVPYVSLTAAAQKPDADTGYMFEKIGAKGVDVSITNTIGFPGELPFWDVAKAGGIESLGNYIAQMAGKVALGLWGDIETEFRKSTNTKTVDDATFDADDVIDLAGACAEKDWPLDNRALVISTALATQLKKDPSLKTASAFGSDEVIREGKIGRLGGFDIYEQPGLGASGEKVVGYIVHKSALALGTKIVQPPILAASDKAQIRDLLVDPNGSGLNFVLRTYQQQNPEVTRQILELFYGLGSLNADALFVLKTA
mgnify:CR=1 FL=1